MNQLVKYWKTLITNSMGCYSLQSVNSSWTKSNPLLFLSNTIIITHSNTIQSHTTTSLHLFLRSSSSSFLSICIEYLFSYCFCFLLPSYSYKFHHLFLFSVSFLSFVLCFCFYLSFDLSLL